MNNFCSSYSNDKNLNNVVNFFEMFNLSSLKNKPENKMEVKKLSTISLAYVCQKKGSRKAKHMARAKVLFDTGCGATLTNKNILSNLKLSKNNSSQNWKTKSGEFQTNMTYNITFTLPQFCWKMYVSEYPSMLLSTIILASRQATAIVSDVSITMN